MRPSSPGALGRARVSWRGPAASSPMRTSKRCTSAATCYRWGGAAGQSQRRTAVWSSAPAVLAPPPNPPYTQPSAPIFQPMAVEVFSGDGRNYLLAFQKGVRNKVYQRYGKFVLSVLFFQTWNLQPIIRFINSGPDPWPTSCRLHCVKCNVGPLLMCVRVCKC